jgi:LacI family transcriptional regulator
MALGVLLPYVSTLIYQNQYCSRLLGGITDELARNGYDLFLHTSLGDNWHLADPGKVPDARVDGLILAAPPIGNPLLERCLQVGFPCIPVDYPPDRGAAYTVNADDFEGGRLATQHLIELGHRRIVHLQGPPEIASAALREAGFRAAMEAAGLPLSESSVVPSGFRIRDGHAAANQLLRRPLSEQPTAIFAANDLCAEGAIRVLLDAGRRVPADFSVVGYDDSPSAERVEPALTSVHAPVYTEGVLAASMLIALVEKRPVEVKHAILPVDLKVRASTGRAPGR